MNEKKLIIFIDSGDTLVDESTEIRKVPGGIVYKASFAPGAVEAVRTLRRNGYRLVMVADGYKESFDRVYARKFLESPFEARVISELVGEEKPSSKMFQAAMDALGLKDEDKGRILMVGNNLERDILGANRFGIRSALMAWSPRYLMTPQNEEERPDYILKAPEELPALADRLEREL